MLIETKDGEMIEITTLTKGGCEIFIRERMAEGHNYAGIELNPEEVKALIKMLEEV